MENVRKLPIGVQDFEKLRRDGFLYIDKTEYIYSLIKQGAPYFLSRPRRFGKSLLLSTLKAYWEGKKELFEGLAIEELIKDDPEAFEPHPVLYFDFNKNNYQRTSALEDVLDEHLKEWEKKYSVKDEGAPLEERFRNVIKAACEATEKQVVVLVDEYDKSLLEVMENNELEEHNKAVFKGFFSTLKSYDRYLKFVFLTGVTKFNKVSIFSDLNQLRDISMSNEYANICGITETEIRNNFAPEVERMAEYMNTDAQGCIDKLRQMYNGYHFHHLAEGVYNPFSLLNALQERELNTYWFATGTPTFLVKKLKNMDFDPERFTDGTLYSDARSLSDYRADNPDPLPLLYQTGYLTILDYDEQFDSYMLGYPNNEVKYGFIESLVPYYLYEDSPGTPLDVRSFGRDIVSGNTDGLRDRFISLFSKLPYPTSEDDDKPLEQSFQNAVYITFMLLGQFVQTEIHSAKGRADVIVETDDYIYIFEFKRDKSADEALEQIESQGYALPYKADKRTLLKVGVNFNSRERTIDDWKVAQG